MKSTKTSSLFVLSLVIASAAVNIVSAATINVGSVSALQSAVNSASPGDIIVLASGTYQNTQCTLNRNGTASSPITIQSAVPGGAVFNSTTRITLQGSYLIFRDFYFNQATLSGSVNPNVLSLVGASNCLVTNNYFYKCGATDNTFRNVIHLEAQSQANTISYNTFDGSRCMSIAIRINTADTLSTNNLIDHNRFINILPVGQLIAGATNGCECVQLGQDSVNFGNVQLYTTVSNNKFQNVTGDGNEIISVKSSCNKMLYNTFQNCNSTVCLRGGNSNQAVGNFFLNTDNTLTQNGGVLVYGNDQIIANNYFQGMYLFGVCLDVRRDTAHVEATDCDCSYNTIVGSRGEGIRIGNPNQSYAPPVRPWLFNNMIRMTGGYAIRINSGGSDITWGPTVEQIGQYAFAGATSSTIVSSSNAIALAADGLYRPGSSSVVINLGSTADGLVINDDMDGQARVGAPDVGADEYSTDSVYRAPLADNQVGSGWTPSL